MQRGSRPENCIKILPEQSGLSKLSFRSSLPKRLSKRLALTLILPCINLLLGLMCFCSSREQFLIDVETCPGGSFLSLFRICENSFRNVALVCVQLVTTLQAIHLQGR